MSLFVRIFITVFIVFYTIPVFAEGPDKIYLNFKNSEINISIMQEKMKNKFRQNKTFTKAQIDKILQPRVSIIKGDIWTFANTGIGWDSKEMGSNIYHIKFHQWNKTFWLIEANEKKVYQVDNGTFGNPGGDKKLLENVEIGSMTLFNTLPLRSSDSYLEFDPESFKTRMYWGDTLILDEGSLEIEKVHKNVFHFKRKGERGNNDFYKLNTLSKEFLRVEGEFGKAGGKERNTHVNVALSRIKSFPKEGKKNADREKAFKEMARQSMLRFKKPELPNPDGIEVWEDFAFKDHEIKKPESNWMESQKTLNEKLLLNNFYDIMVVPFQVQGYGIDKAGRSLMTQFLIDRIEASSKLKVVDSTLLERALGERKRTYNMEKIYELANDLNVKKIIIGYVGHDLDMKMRLTLLVKEASKEELFTEKTKTTTLDRKNLPFSDEHLPYAVFNNLIDSNIIKLPIKLGKYPSAKQYKQIKKLPLPNKIMDMVEGAKKSPLMTAYYLQFLGMLSPEKSLNKEILFGRSLIALSKISEKSPEYKLLKSRALFYLSRRPAALKALGTPKTTDEKAFFALLNGNLPDLKSWLNKIDSPFHKLMAQIELYDLEWSYSNKIADELDIESIVKSNLGLAAELYQRFTSKDDRIIPNNLLVKKQLDENFPIEGFTIESIMKSRAAMGSGSLDDDEIYLSVFNHVQRLLKESNFTFKPGHESISLTEFDYLNLLEDFGESNLLKDAGGTMSMSLELANHLYDVYNGHPEFGMVKVKTMAHKMRQTKGVGKNNLRKEYYALAGKVFYWFQGQSRTSNLCYKYYGGMPKTFYDGDFPMRDYWNTYGSGDRIKINNDKFKVFNSIDGEKRKKIRMLEVGALYSHNNIRPVEKLFKAILEFEEVDASKAFNLIVKDRFNGHPKKSTILAKINLSEGNVEDLKTIHEGSISKNPNVWEPYFKLGKLLISEGEFNKAREVISRYPLFSDNKGSNTVLLTVKAREVGDEFLAVGAFDEAKYFFELSEGYGTGARSELVSQMALSFINQDFAEGVNHAQRSVTRYNKNYPDYIMGLHLMGKHEEAIQIFYERVRSGGISYKMEDAPLVGMLMEGKSLDEMMVWQKNIKNWDSYFVSPGYFLLKAGIIDRDPNEIMEIIGNDYLGYWSFNIPARGYQHLYNKKYSLAYAEYEKNLKNINTDKRIPENARYTMPYFALSAVKGGKEEEFSEYLKQYKKRFGKDFYYYLSLAYMKGSKNKHKQALNYLKLAQYRVKVEGAIPLNPWYQLIETAEYFYNASSKKEYQKLVVQGAKIIQRISPFYSWAYAFEAKFTNSKKDRLRALGITLYLDKNSVRISHFSDEKNREAIEWMENNNPFLQQYEQEQVKKTAI